MTSGFEIRHVPFMRCKACGCRTHWPEGEPVGDSPLGEWRIRCEGCGTEKVVRGGVVGWLSSRVEPASSPAGSAAGTRPARRRKVAQRVGGGRELREGPGPWEPVQVGPDVVWEVVDPLAVVGSEPRTWAAAAEKLRGVTWLWEGWISNGYLTLVIGNADVGKSNLMLALAGVITQGGRWPDGEGYDRDPGKVLFLDTEAALAMHVERARRWGLDLERLLLLPLQEVASGMRLDRGDHLQALEEHLSREDVAAAVIDSLSGGHDWDENSAVMRRLLIRLAEIAARVDKPVVLIHHFRKPLQFEGSEATLDKARGSSTITQIARVVMAIDQPDELRRETRRVLQLKNNFREKPEPFGFEISDEGVTWVGAPEEPKTTAEIEKALGFLQSALRPGPMRSTELKERAARASVSDITLKRARKRLGIVAVPRGGQWWVSLPGRQEELPGV